MKSEAAEMVAVLPASMAETKYHCFLFVHVMVVRGSVFYSLEENRIVVNCPSSKNECLCRSHSVIYYLYSN